MFVKGMLKGEVKDADRVSERRITAEFSDIEIIDAPRPKEAKEVGASIGHLRILNERSRGLKFDTPARLGAGVCLMVNRERLAWARPEWQEKVQEKFGKFPFDKGILGCWRGLAAPGTWACLDTCSGVPEVDNILLGAILEGVEIGFYFEEHYGFFELPPEMSEFQSILDKEHEKVWRSAIMPSKGKRFDIPVRVKTTEGADSINGMPCILSAEPENGSVEVLFLLEVVLPGGGWHVCDCELDREGSPLNRAVHYISPRLWPSGGCAFTPVMFELCHTGLNANAPIIPLAKEVFQCCLNHKVQSVLNRLKWCPSNEL